MIILLVGHLSGPFFKQLNECQNFQKVYTYSKKSRGKEKGGEREEKSLLSLYNINIQEIVQRVRLVQILLLVHYDNKH